MSRPILIVQGAQYGSEGKGQVAAHLCEQYRVGYAVRTGAINAGHTVYYEGKPYKMQQLPTGWVNRGTRLVIGPGAYIHPDTLAHEVNMISAVLGEDVRPRLLIDYRCGVHRDQDTADAQHAGRHLLIGATGKGCAEAIMAKIGQRGTGHDTLFRDHPYSQDYNLVNASVVLMDAYSGGSQILIEGTQGSLLDLHTGDYPFVTSRMTSAANWVAEAGLPPTLEYRTVLVARTHPIRVAGNSGHLQNETSWPTLARSMNARRDKYSMMPLVEDESIRSFEEAVEECANQVMIPNGLDRAGLVNQQNWPDRYRYRDALSSLNAMALAHLEAHRSGAYQDLLRLFELTTVTKKLRRIAHLDRETLRLVVKVERPDILVLTFLNYEFPELWGETEINRYPYVRDYLSGLQADLGGKSIDVVTTDPQNFIGVWPE